MTAFSQKGCPSLHYLLDDQACAFSLSESSFLYFIVCIKLIKVTHSYTMDTPQNEQETFFFFFIQIVFNMSLKLSWFCKESFQLSKQPKYQDKGSINDVCVQSNQTCLLFGRNAYKKYLVACLDPLLRSLHNMLRKKGDVITRVSES